MNDQELRIRGWEIAQEIQIPSKSASQFGPAIRVYHADDIHRLLGESVEVTSMSDKGDWRQTYGWPSDATGKTRETHTALLIAIKPIRQESEERKLLREIVAFEARMPPDIIERARKLLESNDPANKTQNGGMR